MGQFDPAFKPLTSFDPAFKPVEEEEEIPAPPALPTLEQPKRGPLGHSQMVDPFAGFKNSLDRLWSGPSVENSPELAETMRARGIRPTPEGRLFGGDEWLEIPGVRKVGEYLANKIDDPMRRGTGTGGLNPLKNFAAGAVEGAFGLAAGGADPRAVGTKPSPGEIRAYDDFRFSNARDVTPPKPGSSGRQLTTWNTRGTTPEPRPSAIPPSTQRKFLGNAEVMTPTATRESRFKPTEANAPMSPTGVEVQPKPKMKFRMEEDGSVVNTETGEIIHKPDIPQPEFMRAKKEPGNIAVGGAEPRVLDILGTTLYSKNIERVVTKELIQNSADEMRLSGNKGPIKVLFGYHKPIPGTADKGNSVTVRDFGRGMNPDQLYSYFTNVGESGKVDEAGASGGFGFAKAAPLLGGKYAKVVSVTDKGSKRLQYTFEGSPTQLKNQDFGVPLTVKEVDKLTPTGLTVTTYFPKDVSFYDAKDHLENVGKFSTHLAVPVEYGEDHGYGNENKWLDAVEETDKQRAIIPTHSHPARVRTDKNFTANLPSADVDFHIDNSKLGVNRHYNLHVLNNGLYDSSYNWNSYGNDLESVPSDIVANITSKAKEGEPGYPFTVNREQLNQEVGKAIQDTIKAEVADKAREAMIEKVKALHDSIDFWPEEQTPDTAVYKRAILDPKGLYTPEELADLRSHPTVRSLLDLIDSTVNQGLELIGDKAWSDRLTGIGLLTDDGTWGVHIPDAKTNKSTILINPFFEPALPKGVLPTPDRHAGSIAHTILHEMAHIEPKQLGQDPHGQSFALRLAKIYGALGVESDAENEISRQILNIIAPGGGEQYSPDFQELLQQYKETRGRTETKRDLLSGSSEVSYSRARGQGGNGSNLEPNGGGTPPISPRNIDQIYPKGRPRVPKTPEEADVRRLIEEEGDALRAFAIFKGMKATGDMGPMLRQGIAYAGRPAWFRALKQQFISYASEGGHQRFLVDMAKDRLMMPSNRAEGKSWIEIAGVDLSDIKRSKNRRQMEEATMGMDEVEKFLKIPLPGAMGGTINVARASNRAFSDSMNSLRLGVANVLFDNFDKAYKAASKVAKTPEDKLWAENLNPWNPAVAKIMGEDINIGSGRAKLAVPKMNWPGGRRFSKEIDFTPAAEGVNLGLFSGRLFASRLRLLNRTMNPYMYAKAATTPQGRLMMREHLKQLISLVGAAAAMSTFHEIMGGESETDPTSTNFGRSRFNRGKITVDNTGGVGKYATLAARLATGTMKSNKGKKYRLGQNPVIGSALDRVEDFTEGLAAPHVAFIFDLLRGKEYGNKPLNFTSMNPGENTATKDLVNPMIWQDFYEIMKEDPTYIPLIFEDAVGQSVNVR